MTGAEDHRSVDLRRRSFENEALEAADFTAADLRGADFSNARLAGASFRDARLGVPPSVAVAMLVGAFAVAVAAGVVAAQSLVAVRDRLYGSHWEETLGSVEMLVVLVVFIGVMFWKGFDAAVKASAVLAVVAVVTNLIARVIWGRVDFAVGGRGLGLLLLLGLAVFTGILARLVGGAFGVWVISAVALAGGAAAGRFEGGLAGVVVMVALVLISKRALRGDERDRILVRVTQRIVGRWSTRFVGADLTGADFTGAKAGRCDMSGATLDDVEWEPGQAPLTYHDDR